MIIETSRSVMYDLRVINTYINYDSHDIYVAYITNSTSNVVTVNMYRQYMLRGSCGYENPTFYFLYMDPMKDSCVYI